MEYYLYCKKCGRTLLTYNNPESKKCDCCGSPVYMIPEKYFENFRWRDGDGRQALMEELVKTSPEFDPDLYERRDAILAKQNAEYEAAMEIGRLHAQGRDKGNPYGIECPYCHATNIKKLGFFSRVGSAELWGLGSPEIGKNFKCTHCGAYF